MSIKPVVATNKSKAVTEGAGVHLKRALGLHNEYTEFDPFLLLDHFKSNNPEDYIAGFPWHPHRGIETITYMLSGSIIHGDSMGNSGTIGSGDVQWMTAGSGIVHQEMPLDNGTELLNGFQLWANLPASHKMMEPRYRDIKSSQIQSVELEPGTQTRIICGNIDGIHGPVTGIITDPLYLDVSMQPHTEFIFPIKKGYTLCTYVFEGSGQFGSTLTPASEETLLLFGEGDRLRVHAQDNPVRYLILAGKPIKEPIAWYGPIVMNTQEELDTAFREYENGTFIKHPKA
jgi:redox-sensitive bicupin YhaK (pirin superfamily)